MCAKTKMGTLDRSPNERECELKLKLQCELLAMAKIIVTLKAYYDFRSVLLVDNVVCSIPMYPKRWILTQARCERKSFISIHFMQIICVSNV